MNKNTMKGAVIDAVGKIRQSLGRLMGSPKQEVKAVAKRPVGETQKAVGKAPAAVGKGKGKARRSRRKSAKA